MPETWVRVDRHPYVMNHWRRARTRLRQTKTATAWNVAAVAIVAITLLVSYRLLLSSAQYQVNDLVPVGSAGSMLKTCLWPYQYAGLGLPNPAPVPSLCLFGGVAAIIGPTETQHLFLVGCLGGAGLAMFRLLRQLKYSTLFCGLGALLYEFSPAIMNQLQSGGPGILLVGAVFPAIIAETIAPGAEARLARPARAGALLSFVTLFNPQAPFLLAPLIVPFLGAIAVRGGWRSMVRFVGVFACTTLVFSIPLLLAAPGEGTAVASIGQSLATQLITSVRATSVTEFAVPYAYFGLIPAALGAVAIIFRQDRAAFDRAIAVSAAMVVSVWITLRLMPLQLMHVWIGIALFKDFIKLQILFGIPVTVLTVAGIQIAASKDVLLRPRRQLAVALSVAVAVTGVLIAGEGPALASGDVGLASYSVPAVYASALNAIQRTAPASSSYRNLWLPQDLSTIGTLSTLDPSSFVYRSAAAPLVRKAVLQTFTAFVSKDDANIAPLLTQDGVRFIVVATDLQVQPDAPFESAPPNIAAIGGTQVLAGSARYFLDILNKAPGIVRISRSKGYALYENRLWRPMLSHYRAMLVFDRSDSNAAVPVGSPLGLNWTPLVGTESSITRGDVTIRASSRPTWSPVIARVTVKPGAEYQISSHIAAHNALNTHIKVQWLGGPSLTTTYVVILTSPDSVRSITTRIVAPKGASVAQVMLMGGWTTAPGGFSSFQQTHISPIVPTAPSLENASTPLSEWMLGRQLPNLLVEADTQPTEVRALPQRDVVSFSRTPCLPSQQHCANLLAFPDVHLRGNWAFTADIPSAGPLSWFTEDSRRANLTIPRRVLNRFPNGSVLSWLTFPDGNLASLQPIAHALPVPSGNRALDIASPGIGGVIANLAITPPVPRYSTLTRVLTAYSLTLLVKPGNQRPILIPGDWASVYVGSLASTPSPAGDGIVWLRLLGIGLSLLLIAAALLFGRTRRTRSRHRSA